MPKKPPPLPAPTLTQADDETWTLSVPGIASSAGHPAPEWAMAKGVEVVRRAATDIVKKWVAGRSVTPEEQQVVLLVTKGDSQVYAWLESALAAE